MRTATASIAGLVGRGSRRALIKLRRSDTCARNQCRPCGTQMGLGRSLALPYELLRALTLAVTGRMRVLL